MKAFTFGLRAKIPVVKPFLKVFLLLIAVFFLTVGKTHARLAPHVSSPHHSSAENRQYWNEIDKDIDSETLIILYFIDENGALWVKVVDPLGSKGGRTNSVFSRFNNNHIILPKSNCNPASKAPFLA